MQQVFHNFVFLFIRTLALLRTLICRKRCNKRAEGLLQAIACSNLNFPGQLIRCPRARASRTTRCPAAIVHFRDRAVPVSSKKIMPALAESHRAPDPEFKRPCRTVIARHRNTVANISASPYFLRFPLPTLSPPFFFLLSFSLCQFEDFIFTATSLYTFIDCETKWRIRYPDFAARKKGKSC